MSEKYDFSCLESALSNATEDLSRFSENYLKLREQFMVQRSSGEAIFKEVSAPEELFRDKQSLTEKQLRAIWYDGKFEHRGLKTTDGRRMKVISPGAWNSQAGPDFLNAEISIEEKIVQGDVEVHLTSGDWKNHGHHKDPKYDRLILHVVFLKHGFQPFVSNRKGEKIPQLELKNILSEKMNSLLHHFDVEGYPYKSNAVLGECGKKVGFPYRVHPEKYDFIQSLLRLAGDGRMLLKGSPFVKLLSERKLEGVNALLYERMMEGLGYSENKSAMRQLSKKVPYAAMKKIALENSGEIRIQRMQAFLLYAAGLLPDSSEKLDEDAKKYGAVLQSQLESLDLPEIPMIKTEWKFRGVRPHNYPARRLVGFSYFLAQNLEGGLFQSALEMIQKWKQQDHGRDHNQLFSSRLSDIQKFIFQPGWGYFGQHATLGGKKLSQKVALIGKERALTLWVNSFLPVLAVWCKQELDEKLEEELFQFWRRLPALRPNRISKMMLLRFMGAKGESFPVKTEQIQQGLIQLFQDFCDTKPTACIGCPFPRLAALSIPELFRSPSLK